ncbi:MAG: redoxin domain-containing protein [Gemmataceae bacterium]|nr:redoxin domain-containing protein [Gemmataceae bacterium]
MNSALLTLALMTPGADPEPPAPVGRKVADFTRTDAASGKPWTLAEGARGAKATVVVFLNTGCPVSTAYARKLAKLHERYAPEGVAFVGVFSGDLDTPAEIAKHAKDTGLPFPVLKDDGTKLADQFAVDRVPTAFVLDAGRAVRYAGRVDDQYAPGVHRAKATTREVGNAVDAILDGREVTVAHVPAAGCKLTRDREVKASAVTYHKDVAAIFQSKCQECHRPGEAGPFALTGYKQAKGWADMIREVVADGVMPPWHADAPRGHFLNDRRLSDEQKKTVLAWVDAGCPEGDPKDAPPAPKWVAGWRLPKEPDLVIKMEHPVDVPGQYLFGLGGMPYQHIRSGEPFKEDTWVQAVEVRPEYRAVVHHIIVYAFPPGAKLTKEAEFAQYMLGTYVPGDQPTVMPDGFATKIVKGTRLMFEMHYTPNGTPGKDQSMVGIIKAKGPPKFEAKGDAAMEGRFVIPPGDPAHEVKAAYTFDKAATLTSLYPHMHLRGKAFKYDLVTPDGKRETVLNVPKYDFNWQVGYHLSEPRAVPAGSKLECTAWFDNSTGNPANPDPEAKVRWGDQTWEEMMIGFFSYYQPAG